MKSFPYFTFLIASISVQMSEMYLFIIINFDQLFSFLF